MEPFDYEKAKQGRQLIHANGTKALDWYMTNADSKFPLAVWWDNGWEGQYRVDGKLAEQGEQLVFLASEPVVEYVPYVPGEGFYRAWVSIGEARSGHPEAIAIYKLTVNPDNLDDITIERVE